MSAVLSILILWGGISMTFATGFVQRKLGVGTKMAFVKESGQEGLSSFGILCTTLAATLGTGNIVGVATAVTAGGPGALFWMVVASVPCMALKYAECALSVEHGGPFAYIQNTLGGFGAKAFAFCGAAAGVLGFGTLTQADGIVTVLQHSLDPLKQQKWWGIPTVSLVTAICVAMLAGMVLWGGMKRISTVCETVVPMMALGYIVCCVLVLFRCRGELLKAITVILQEAWSLRAGWGGLLGTVSLGISRGIFSNEAGLGSAPIASAQAKDQNPMRQGLIGQSGVFIDTTLMCTLSGLCLVVTGSYTAGLDGAAVTALAFESVLGKLAGVMLGVFLCFFAFTTIVGWYFYARQCFCYLTEERGEKIFRFLYVGMILLTPLLNTRRIWGLADWLSAGMALPNLVALWKLRRQIPLFKTNK